MTSTVANLPAHELTARLYELRSRERQLLVEFLVHLGELDRRRLYLELGFPSLFAFLTDYLGYTNSSAFRRATAARLVAQFPGIAAYLADGRLCLTTLVELRHVLDDVHLDEILARAAGRSEDEVKRLVAALRPQPAPPDLLRRVPVRTSEASVSAAADAPTQMMTPSAPVPARVVPVSATQHVLRATVSDEFVRDLEAVRAALGHKLPGGSLEAILHECVRVTLAHCEKRRRGAGKPAGVSANENAPSRYVPAAVRDEVWRRDCGRCAFVGTHGHVCSSTHQLELHHVLPFARGGAATVDNLQLRCRQHNRYEAERDFGVQHVERAIERSRAAPIDPRQASLF